MEFIPSNRLESISEDLQKIINELDLSQFSNEKVQSIIGIDSHCKAALKALKPENLKLILDKLHIDQLQHIPIDKLNQLDLLNLSNKQAQSIFTHNRCGAALKVLPSEQVPTIINKLNEVQLESVPDEILQTLDWSQIEEAAVQKLFAENDYDNIVLKFKKLYPSLYQSPPPIANQFVEKLSEEQLKALLFGGHKKLLDFTTLYKETVVNIFNKIDDSEDEDLFNSRTPEERESIKEKLSEDPPSGLPKE